jgi:beta-phosphoglucomutase
LSSTLKAVIFDLDGVITDTARYHYLAWQKLADELGIYFDEQINERLKGVERMSSLEIILERSMAEFPVEQKIQWANQKNEYYKELVVTMTPAELSPGTREVMNELKDKGIKIGLASVSKNAMTVIEKLQIGGFFDYIADATRIHKSKPDPEIFLTVAENLQVAVKSCIGVEDASAGIKAIKAAGMFAVGVGDPKILREADVVITGIDAFDLQRYIGMLKSDLQ